jgi:hypothetical protein
MKGLFTGLKLGSTALLLTVGCGRQTNSGYTEQQVAAIVVPGATREAVERAFGSPTASVPTSDGTVKAIYQMPLPRRPKPYRNKFTGFQVDYRDGRVLRSSPLYSDLVEYHAGTRENSAATPPPMHTAIPRNPGNAPLEFFLVKDSPFSSSHLLDTPALPKAGYISDTPDLTVPSVNSVTAGDMSGTPAIQIQLNPADAARLRALTQTNLGNRVAFAIGTNIVSAPRVRGVIKNGQFTVTFPKAGERDQALRLLRGSEAE